MSIKLSIVVPVYNTELYIEQCIQSIIPQLEQSMELILVDDGSPDLCPEICDKYAIMHNNVSVVHKVNGGAVSARNAGIAYAKGEYVTFVDSDDYVLANHFNNYLDIIQSYNPDIISDNLLIETNISTRKYEQPLLSGYYDRVKINKEVLPVMLVHPITNDFGIMPSLCTKCIKKEILKKNIIKLDERITLGDDAALLYPCIMDAESLFVSDEASYVYRMNENSITHKYDSRLSEKIVILLTYLMQTCSLKSWDAGDQLIKYVLKMNHAMIDNEVYYCNDNIADRKKRLRDYKNNPIVKESCEKAFSLRELPILYKFETFALQYNCLHLLWMKKHLGNINRWRNSNA